MNTTKLALWRKDSGNYMSASKGLTEEQVEMFHNVQVGDRFIAFYNSPKEKFSESSPDLSLQVYQNSRKVVEDQSPDGDKDDE